MLTHLFLMQFTTLINWTNQLLGSNFQLDSNFNSTFCKQIVQNMIMVLYCLPESHKNDRRYLFSNFFSALRIIATMYNRAMYHLPTYCQKTCIKRVVFFCCCFFLHLYIPLHALQTTVNAFLWLIVSLAHPFHAPFM